jgi:hypothetical protein
MTTQAYFENIHLQIIKQINEADHSIFVAVAWLTDKSIFHALCNKASQKVKVEILLVDDSINNEMVSFDHRTIEKVGGNVYFISPKTDGAIMHHKFCVIDSETVITGSYNWSNKAHNNDENIVITTNAKDLGERFISEFKSIRARILKTTNNYEDVDFSTVLKRLDVITSFILLNEKEEILSQINKIKNQSLSNDIIEIINQLEKGEYSTALILIEEFKRLKSKIAVFDDFDVFGLQLELNSIEIQLNAIENEKIDIEKKINEFSIQYNKVLGVLILQVLNLRSRLAKTTHEKAKTEKEESDYKEDYESKKDVSLPILSINEEKELKSAYREASLICHPDKFHDDPDKAKMAQEVFVVLANAFKSNDIKKVKEILVNLKAGVININDYKQSNKKETLLNQISILKQKLKKTADELIKVKLSETFKIISDYPDLTVYFCDIKTKLTYELELLQNKINAEK